MGPLAYMTYAYNNMLTFLVGKIIILMPNICDSIDINQGSLPKFPTISSKNI